MAWTAPKTWAAGVLLSSDMNTHIRDNLLYLKARVPDYVKLSFTQASGPGGTATSGSWLVRPINTEDNDASGICTLASNQFTLEAGTYDCSAWGIFHGAVDSFQQRLYNVTDAAVVVWGSIGRNISTNDSNPSFVAGRFTLANSKTLRLEYQVDVTITTLGLGNGGAFGQEVYAVIELWRVEQ